MSHQNATSALEVCCTACASLERVLLSLLCSCAAELVSVLPDICLSFASLFRETEPNWDEDIEKDVKEECGKYGAVNHAHVDKNSKVRP